MYRPIATSGVMSRAHSVHRSPRSASSVAMLPIIHCGVTFGSAMRRSTSRMPVAVISALASARN